MEIEVDLYLAGMANDSARWKRLGRFGTVSFVEGLLDGLTAVGAITSDEAAAWRELLLAPFNIAQARFSSTSEVSKIPPAFAPSEFPRFVELIPAAQPAQDLPDVCSFQILGVERYDVKGAILWRMVPILGPESSEEARRLAALGTGPDMIQLKFQMTEEPRINSFTAVARDESKESVDVNSLPLRRMTQRL